MGITWLSITFSSLMFASSVNTENYILSAECPLYEQSCDFTVTLEAKKNWRIKKQTPLKIELKLPKDAIATQTTFSQTDLVLENDKRGKLRSKITLGSSKLDPISMTASFYLCTAQICQRFQKTLKIKTNKM